MKSPRIIGHRGAAGHEPENTLASFAKAIELGAQGIELDVHLSADGKIMVIHDTTLERTTGHLNAVNHTSFDELRILKIEQKHLIPTLEEVLDLCPKNFLVNIEIKDPKAAQPVAALLSDLINSGKNARDFLVSSFDWTILELIREVNPTILLGVLTEKNIEQAIIFGQQIKALSIHPNQQHLTAENTKRIKEHGFEIHAWTVNEYSDIDRIKTLNVDAIITDYPDRI